LIPARDTFLSFRHKEFNRCSSGELVGYTGLFGRGKTLSAALTTNPSGAPRRKKFVTQRIKVISNVLKAGDMMSEEEILKLQQNSQEPNMEGVMKPSKRWMRLKHRENKK